MLTALATRAPGFTPILSRSDMTLASLRPRLLRPSLSSPPPSPSSRSLVVACSAAANRACASISLDLSADLSACNSSTDPCFLSSSFERLWLCARCSCSSRSNDSVYSLPSAPDAPASFPPAPSPAPAPSPPSPAENRKLSPSRTPTSLWEEIVAPLPPLPAPLPPNLASCSACLARSSSKLSCAALASRSSSLALLSASSARSWDSSNLPLTCCSSCWSDT
mmetsp:Transcript_18006/g.39922  ORF Transcript_18006/g.39922 Transcript_18006/m.39922 type:complete len:222 (-) Transcript_18006:2023-2688(-)